MRIEDTTVITAAVTEVVPEAEDADLSYIDLQVKLSLTVSGGHYAALNNAQYGSLVSILEDALNAIINVNIVG